MLNTDDVRPLLWRAARFVQHFSLVLATLREAGIITLSGSDLRLFLGTAAAGAIVHFGLLPRRSRALNATLSSLSWTGHTLETIRNFHRFSRHLTPLSAFALCACACAMIVAVFRKTSFPNVLRAHRCSTWRALLIILNFTALLLNAHLILSDLSSTPLYWCYVLGMPILAFSAVLYWPLCALQDAFARWRIRRRATGAAARLPPEIQLQIFQLLRMRSRFGATECLPRGFRSFESWRAIPFAAARDLASAARVCAAWHGAATEALYTDVSFRHEKDVIALTLTLAARPELAVVVRRILLPEDAPYSPSQYSTVRVKYDDFARAVDRLLALCTGATEVLLFRDSMPLTDVPGFRAAGHLRTVTIYGGPAFASGRQDDPQNRAEVDVLALLQHLPHLESLALDRQFVVFDAPIIPPPMLSALRNIHTLRLGECTVDVAALVRLLRALPRLRVADLRHVTFAPADTHTALSFLFSAQLGTLTELTLHVTRHKHLHPVPRILISDLGDFTALRVLRIDVPMLCALRIAPPRLEHLAVSMAPSSSTPYFRRVVEKSIFTAAGNVRAVARNMPGLRSVQVWDEVALALLPAWRVAAIMLRVSLAPAGVDVAVNLLQSRGRAWHWVYGIVRLDFAPKARVLGDIASARIDVQCCFFKERVFDQSQVLIDGGSARGGFESRLGKLVFERKHRSARAATATSGCAGARLKRAGV
ncbi:hypothetical protein AURDEDRAFT_131337 [Auricularia subglabra TFB-10046 SS5]|uniref:Uncharacterized protein n=1 Tax=Auricularia subglabra (strain TFB-10046 / SS5) TaxID=717982 RepID=J0WQE9_AURST|nr:hypothetical protein AURDEDRAFT_131337 [Auricularia subglabra TFB-10046 SS5]